MPTKSNSNCFDWRTYQVDDLAAAALVDGLIYCWEPGLGKSLAAFAWPILKGSKLNLLVAPGSLHDQLKKEGLEKFGVTVKDLPNQATFYADPVLQRRWISGELPEEAHWYITSYTALGLNGADEEAARPKKGELVWTKAIEETRRFLARRVGLKEFPSTGIGEDNEDGTIRCLVTPSLATLTADVFDCVVCDEAVRIKSSTSFVGLGVRKLRPAYRLVLTGTPIKNRLGDIFWLAWWACGGSASASARWAYDGTDSDKTEFEKIHSVEEQNITKEKEFFAETGVRKIFKKRTAQICNLHLLWKTLGPTYIRRRKCDIGQDLVTKTFVPMKVKMGTDQRAVYQFHAQNKPEQSTAGEEMGRLAAVGCQVNLLRQAALCPDSHSLTKFHRDLGGRGMLRSRSIHTPKLAATMQLIGDCLHDGEQVVLFSPFQHFNDTILGILRRSCVSAVLLDGKTNEQERGRQAGRFKNKEYSVLLAGLKSMSEGHSFDQCCRLILPTLEWAFDLNAQAVERVHRVNSKKPVTIYTLVTEGTIDIRLTNLFEEKGDAADLALDGQLFERATEEINLGDLLREAIKDFDPAEPTVDEADIAQQWPQQQAYLNAGEKHFRSLYPATMPLTSLPQPRTPKAPAGIPNSDIADQVMNQLELLLAG